MGLHEDLIEDHPTGRPITSPNQTSTGRPGTISDVITSPAAQGPPSAGLKRKHASFTNSSNLWSETRFRPGHGIRLLRLYGGASNAPLQGRLILSDGKETYEALSYAGEPEEGNSPISIISAGSTYTLAIKPNLEAALRQLRFPDRYRLLWIDSICINQEDLSEKNFHIQRMGSIFNTASNVCIWLGTADEQSSQAFEMIRQAHEIDINSAEADAKELLDALISLLRRRWFTRRWAIQEVALARKASLYCGPNSISWTEFADAITLLQSTLSRVLPRNAPEVVARASARSRILASAAGCHFVDVSNDIFRKSDEGTILDSLKSLESLMCNLSSFETSNFHDNIYAYLSLAEDTGARYSVRAAAAFSMAVDDTDPIPVALSPTEQKLARSVVNMWRRAAEGEYRVDYNKSVVEVCRDFVAFAVNKTGSLDIICRPWAPAAYRRQLPSWIATLANREFQGGLYARAQADALVGLAGTNKKPYNASRRYPVAYSFGDPSIGSLFVDGCILDSIKEIGPIAQIGVPTKWRELGGWNGGSPPPERFWRTLTGNRGQDASNPPHYFKRACAFFFASERTADDQYATTVRDDHPKFVAEYLQRVQAIIWKRRMIITGQERLLGLAPEGVQDGDLICIIFGCSVPVALRKMVSDGMTGEHHYELVGDCYVHGMMDGEAFTMQQTRNIPQTQFELR
jgi:hypothetical protein